MRRGLTVALLVSLALSALTLPAAGSQALVVRSVDTSAAPRISLELALPSELFVGGSERIAFSVAENGARREVLEAAPTATERTPLDAVLVLDASGSMQGGALRSAKQAALLFAERVAPTDRVALVTFATRARVVTGLSEDRAALARAIGRVSARGETALYDGVRKAAALLAKRSEREGAIILLTDGADTASLSTLDDAVGAVRAARVPVFAVYLPTGQSDRQALTALAKGSGGKVLGVQRAEDLPALYESLAQELSTRYRVVYRSASPLTKELDIEVTARGERGSASARTVIDNPYFTQAKGVGQGTEPASPVRSGALATASVALAFLAAALGSWSLLGLMAHRSPRIEELRFYDQAPAAEQRAGASAVRVGSALKDALAALAGKRGFTKLLLTKLERAGLPLRPVEYMYFHVLAVIALGILAQLLTGNVALSAIVVIAAVVLPILMLENAIERRRRAFEEQLPEILGLIAGSLRAGWGVQQSIELVAREMGEPASSEFQRAQAEMRLGSSVEDALAKMAERLDSEDFRWTVSAIAIQRDVGGNLAEVLDILANTMREREELKRHIRALTAEGRLSAIVLVVLPFLMLAVLMVLNPEYMQTLFGTGAGLLMLAIGGVLLAIGGVWLSRVTRVEV